MYMYDVMKKLYNFYIHKYFSLKQDLCPVLQYLTAVFVTGWKEVVVSDNQESSLIVDEVGFLTVSH